jgi:ribosome-associated protein
MKAPRNLYIPESELHYSSARASGPGGQNVQKVETKVTLVFDYRSSSSLSDEQKSRLSNSAAVKGKLDSQGAISISSQQHRTQLRNKEEALKKLYALIALALHQPRKRVPTKKTRSSERRRVETKRTRSGVKQTRRKVSSARDYGD